MNGNEIISSVFLGTGKPQPGLSVMGAGQTQASRLVDKPPGHSVYAIDVDPEQNLVAIGTRAGEVEILSWPRTVGSSEPGKTQSLRQGASVLSVCLLGDSQFASTDITGRCLLWPPLGDSDTPKTLEVDGGLICSLLRLPDNQMLGLSSKGRLLFWHIQTGRLLRTIDSPKPPRKFAMVRLLYWPKCHAVVYPSADGQLVAYRHDDSELSVCEAHDGEFYATAVEGDHLHTFGRDDGLMRTWRDVGSPASEQCQSPRGSISGEFLGNGTGRILLVGDGGNAAIYALKSGHLRLICRLEGTHYRVAVAPSPHIRQDFGKKQRLKRANQLRTEIETRIESKRLEGIEELHRELVGLGFETASLALRAQQAAQEGDIIGELRTRKQLVQSLPSKDQRATTSLLRYAKLLEMTWQLAEAQAILAPVSSVDSEGKATWWDEAIDVLKGEDWVVEPDLPMQLVIEAATVMDRPFVGRWLLRAHSTPEVIADDSLSAQAIAAKYKQVRENDNRQNLPDAEARTLWWVSRRAIIQKQVVIFTSQSGSSNDPITPALQVLHDRNQSLIVPVILFDAGNPGQVRFAEEHNSRMLASLGQLNESLTQSWLGGGSELVTQALRRLKSEAIASHGRRGRN